MPTRPQGFLAEPLSNRPRWDASTLIAAGDRLIVLGRGQDAA